MRDYLDGDLIETIQSIVDRLRFVDEILDETLQRLYDWEEEMSAQ